MALFAAPPRPRKCSKPGSYLAQNPLVTTAAGQKAALCERCQGCPAAQCGANGCATCPITGLLSRVPLTDKKTPAGDAVYACQNTLTSGPIVSLFALWVRRGGHGGRAATPGVHLPILTCAEPCTAATHPSTPLQAFKGFPNANLPNTSVYPASEFAGCGGSGVVPIGQYMITFSSTGFFKPSDWCASHFAKLLLFGV